MTKTLSICIPTYNRGSKLKQQIESIISITNPYSSACEIIISDNHSTDNTVQILNVFQKEYPGKFIVFQQKENIGFVKNYKFLINQAINDFIWILGDDDPVYPSVLDTFFKIDISSKELHAFHYNHKCITDKATIIHERFYSFHEDIYSPTGRDVFYQLATDHQLGGLMFISATILQTTSAKHAIATWPQNSNQALPLYVSAYAASKGGFYFSSDNKLDCIYGSSFWKNETTHVFIHDVSEIITAFRKLNYSRRFCVVQFRMNIKKYIGWKGFIKLCYLKPVYAFRIILFFVKIIL